MGSTGVLQVLRRLEARDLRAHGSELKVHDDSAIKQLQNPHAFLKSPQKSAGSGKSSLILSLLRMIEPHQGTQLIDGVDIGELGLHDLRKAICMIPQVCFFDNINRTFKDLGDHADRLPQVVKSIVIFFTPP